jgi:hypothetical protein
MRNHQAHMAVAMLKTVLWVWAVAIPLVLLFSGMTAPYRGYPVSVAAIGGGFVFGLGAAINDGCALSTLWHLASGNLGMLATIGGYCLGVAALAWMVPLAEPVRTMTPFFLKASRPMLWALLSFLWFYLCWEIWHLWYTRPRRHRWPSLFWAKQYRLSTAAMIVGLSGGVLYASHEVWTYTNLVKQTILALRPSVGFPRLIDMIPVCFLFGGMLLSALQSGRWRLQWRGYRSWLRHAVGGLLMGAGALLIPGGNDALLLKGLPGLSPHAAPAMIALFFGIGTGLALLRWFTGKALIVVCKGDICRPHTAAPKRRDSPHDREGANS